MILVAVLNLLVLAASTHGNDLNEQVRTSYGVVQGRTLLSMKGRKYLSFSGIPFAQPPVGSLRFKPPQPPKPWKGVLDATKNGPVCAQGETPTGEVKGQEDCLYITVNTPNISSSLPVLVYIHGGAFVVGPLAQASGTIEMGSKFMDEDVVLVAMHYRLGFLGFLSLENEEIPGNYGLKDQAAAIEWVKKEIHHFGGNPELISTFGISAGAASSHYMCSIHRIRKLLKGCISGSGVAGSPWSLRKKGEAREFGLKALKSIGCEGKKVLPCLQAKNVKEFMFLWNTQYRLLEFVPSIEPVHDGALITDWPPKNTNFPWITGHTANEGLLVAEPLKYSEGDKGLEPYLKNWENFFIETFRLKNDAKSKAKKIHERFFVGAKDLYKAVEQLYTESLFVYPALKAASLHTGPKYFYVFNYTGGPTSFELSVKKNLNTTGVGHGDDGIYFFTDNDGYKPEGWPAAKDVQFMETLIKFWVQFVRTKNPNWNSKMKWSQFFNGRYQHLANTISMQQHTKRYEIITFWDSIFN